MDLRVAPPLTLQERLKPIQREFRAFLEALPSLLADGHRGRHVLIKDDKVVSVWDTGRDAYQAGRELFGWGVQFLAQPIDPSYLEFPWPAEVLPVVENKSA